MMKLSIITPSFNQGRFIEKTIQSVLQQNIPNLEYLVMDGGSQDETVSILEHYAANLSYVSEPDRGQAHAVNKGLAQASGDIIGWLNSDDIYYPDTLQKVLNYFAAYPSVDVIYGDAFHIDQDDQFLERYPTEVFNLERLKSTCYFSQPAVFFRKKCVEQYGYLDETLHFCMDYEYWLRLALQGVQFHYLPEVFSGSRFYPQTKTCRSPLSATYEALLMLKKHLGYVPTRWLINYAYSYAKQHSGYLSPHPLFLLSFFKTFIANVFMFNSFIRAIKVVLSTPYELIKQKLTASP